MKIKNAEIQGLISSLAELAVLKTNFKVAYAVSKTIKKVEEAGKDYDKTRVALMTGFCVKEENGNPKLEENNFVFENDETKAKAIEEVANLLNLEVDIDIHSLPASDFESIEGITASLVYRIDRLITPELEKVQ